MNAPVAHNALQATSAVCATCEQSFTPARRWSRFCSTRCRNAWHSWTKPEAVREARNLVRMALEGSDQQTWNPRARKLLGIK